MSLKVNLETIQLDKTVGGKVIVRSGNKVTIKLNDSGMTVVLDVVEATASEDIVVGSEVAIASDGLVTAVVKKAKAVDTTTKRTSGCTAAERQLAKAGL